MIGMLLLLLVVLMVVKLSCTACQLPHIFRLLLLVGILIVVRQHLNANCPYKLDKLPQSPMMIAIAELIVCIVLRCHRVVY